MHAARGRTGALAVARPKPRGANDHEGASRRRACGVRALGGVHVGAATYVGAHPQQGAPALHRARVHDTCMQIRVKAVPAAARDKPACIV
jgi:hypothetical protein